MFMPFQTLDHTRELAQSALPEAPVVVHVPASPRRAGAMRRKCAKALYALALQLEGCQPQPCAELGATELAH